MKRCFICNRPLTGHNITNEHVFLHGLGDKLSSKSLICTKCNNILGQTVDYPLVKDLSQYTGIKNITNNLVFFKANDNKLYVYNPKNQAFNLKHPYIKPPVISSGKTKRIIKLDSIFPTPTRFKHLSNYKKTINNYIHKTCSKYNIPKDKFPRPIEVTKHIDGHKNIHFHTLNYVFEICKMATEFALLCGIPPRYLKLEHILLHLIVIEFNYGNTKMTSLNQIKDLIYCQYLVSHKIIKHPNNNISSDSKKIKAKLFTRNNKLYCWISLFGLLTYTVPLAIDSNYYRNCIFYYRGDNTDFKMRYKNKLNI